MEPSTGETVGELSKLKPPSGTGGALKVNDDGSPAGGAPKVNDDGPSAGGALKVNDDDGPSVGGAGASPEALGNVGGGIDVRIDDDAEDARLLMPLVPFLLLHASQMGDSNPLKQLQTSHCHLLLLPEFMNWESGTYFFPSDFLAPPHGLELMRL